MTTSFELNAQLRPEKGKGASRRLRRLGRIPAVLYGGHQPPQTLSLEQREILRHMQNENFYSQVLTVKIGERTEQAILKELQRHPYKPTLLHLDLQRIAADQKVRVHVPLHFINEATSRGVKLQGGLVSHLRIEVEVECLPSQLPSFIEVDLTDLAVGESIHLSELKLPEGVALVELAHGGTDVPVVSIHGSRKGDEAGDEAEKPAAPST